jgi:alkylhydroperoxidase family enzyme
VGRTSGITEQQLRDLARFEESGGFSVRERLVLRLAVALTSTPASVDDALFAELRRDFSEPQLAELAMAIAWENGRARFNRTFAIAAEGFSQGAFCPLLERRA